MYKEFWEGGHRVFGLWPIRKGGGCACGNEHCNGAGKHPVASNWQHTPIWAAEQIDAMEQAEQFKTGYGVLIRDLLVIDVDARNSGVASFERLRSDIPAIEKCGLVVATGSGGGSRHMYFRAPSGMALLQHHADYPGIDFKSSGYVVGPGSVHSSGKKYSLEYGSVDDIDDAPQELLEILKRPELHRSEFAGTYMDVSHSDLAGMLAVINPDCEHELWIRCGMACHQASGGTAFAVWDDWSARGGKYPGKDNLERRWHSFGKSVNPVTLGTLVHHAENNGWQQSVTFEPSDKFEIPETGKIEVDLLRPPGFVGQVCEWINSQSRRPRENLAVGAALTAVGNIIGLKYRDDYQATSNLFSFFVADPRTGKEPIQQAIRDLHVAAGIHKATHGAIKSEQEVVRNLIRHQSCMYILDEFGLLLQKLKNASARGGAAYLEGVIAILMSVYSKADAYFLISGDLKDEIRKALNSEYAAVQKMLDDGRPVERRAERIKSQLEKIDDGIEKPFLSIAGFTTPETFDTLLDFQSAANGFVGRALVFRETDPVPRLKKGFSKNPIQKTMAATLAALYTGGEYDMTEDERLEYYGEPIRIPSSPEAIERLEQVSDEFQDMAEAYAAQNGLGSLALGAFELVLKVSFILAAPSGLRTVEHVDWAAALVRRDIDAKAVLVTANDREKSAPADSLRFKLLNLIGFDDYMTFGVICNKIRKARQSDVQACLDSLVKANLLDMDQRKTKYRKDGVKAYRRRNSAG